MSKAVIFDRDGTLNKFTQNRYVLALNEFQLFSEVKSTLASISKTKRIGIVTNQRCIGLGLVDWSSVYLMHRLLCEEIELELRRFPILVCPHEVNSCNCRKPKGLNLIRMSRILEVKVSDCVFVGDSYSDYLAAKEVGMSFILIDRTRSNSSCEFDFKQNVRIIYSLEELLHL
jgi:D-glycero-D-manno-heptose 1,7-bisphosphate phosphatase